MSERFEELAALHAAGAATDIERAELERIVRADPAAAAELAAWEATASAFAEALEPASPPAGGLESLRAALAAEEIAAPPSAFSDEPPPTSVANPEYAGPGDGKIISLAARRAKRVLGGSLAVALAAAAAFLFLWLSERKRGEGFREEAKDAQAVAVEAVRKDAQAEIERLAKDYESRSKLLAARF